ncbi:hypothetical protein PIB30_090647 [Stylosanthes scabra]|uniref:Ubiquitin-like protease family profile domain-containing protein n=1 Tax=Stylosanthes scabra TaxID=79078 RepID=A0ABU6XTP8_9FABA|nr:hypothetical protein [Stylosanthes scabra]
MLSEFEHQNEEDDDQQERDENESLITSSQVETELNKIWAMMVIDEDLLVKVEEEAHRYFASKKKPDIIYAKYNDGPSFSLGFSQEFNTPRPSPDGSASEDTEVLDIPPIREMLPEDINTTITDKNLDAYHKDGTYVGMHPNLGKDGKHFDGDKAANRKWWLLPVCNRLHWYLYAFNLEKKDLLVLDSMYDHAFDELRKSLDKYVGKIIEDMLKIVIPTFDHKGLGFPSRYAKVPKQPNNDDCDIYVINLLEEWKEDSELPTYNNEESLKIWRRLVLDIALSNYNTNRLSLLQKAFTITQRRNNPNRGKNKEVKTPFTAPSTKEITRRAENRK